MVCNAAAMEQREQFARSWYREGGRLLLQSPGRQQIRAGAHLGAVLDRIGPTPWPCAAWQLAHIGILNRPSTLVKAPAVDPRKEQWATISASNKRSPRVSGPCRDGDRSKHD